MGRPCSSRLHRHRTRQRSAPAGRHPPTRFRKTSFGTRFRCKRRGRDRSRRVDVGVPHGGMHGAHRRVSHGQRVPGARRALLELRSRGTLPRGTHTHQPTQRQAAAGGVAAFRRPRRVVLPSVQTIVARGPTAAGEAHADATPPFDFAAVLAACSGTAEGDLPVVATRFGTATMQPRGTAAIGADSKARRKQRGQIPADWNEPTLVVTSQAKPRIVL
jgi:hypothetical protein